MQVIDGHTVCVSVRLTKPSIIEVEEAFRSFRGLPQETCRQRRSSQTACSPSRTGPQPRRDALREGGSRFGRTRARECPLFGYKFVCLGHNTVRSAARRQCSTPS
ncbi:MAG: hypothetical protein R2748_19840 [Bryobacterales bacterium]